MSDPCAMEIVICVEEILEEAQKQQFEGGIIVVGFHNGEGLRYISPIADRYAAAGHLMQLAQFLLSDEGEESVDEEDGELAN